MSDLLIQQNNYFRFRKVSPEDYKDYMLPLWILQEIPDKSSNILDYGCGFGQTLAALKKAGFTNIYGVDIEKSAISYCIKEGYNVKELNSDNLKNPFPIKFDVILLLHVLEHIPKNMIINTLRIIKEDFLADNGKLLIAVPNAQSNTGCYWDYEDWTHTTLFTSGSIYYVLKAAGFEKVEFLDIDCTLGRSKLKSIIRKFFLKIYKITKSFWNKITCSAYHPHFPQIFSYEIKLKAQ